MFVRAVSVKRNVLLWIEFTVVLFANYLQLLLLLLESKTTETVYLGWLTTGMISLNTLLLLGPDCFIYTQQLFQSARLLYIKQTGQNHHQQTTNSTKTKETQYN